MKTFEVRLLIRAECKADAEELLYHSTGVETFIEILTIKKVVD